MQEISSYQLFGQKIRESCLGHAVAITLLLLETEQKRFLPPDAESVIKMSKMFEEDIRR